MQTLTMKVYNDEEQVKIFNNIEYINKLNIIYFKIENTKYYLDYQKQTLKYVGAEEKVTINFKTNLLNIHLIKYNYLLEMEILKSKYINKNKEFIIEYILKDDMIKRTIIITMN